MSRGLREHEIARYRRDGIVYPLQVLEPAEADAFRGHCDELERQLGGKPRTIEVRQMHLHFPWAAELAAHPAILDAVESLLGPDLLVWATELFSKHASDGKVAIGWHRDRPYMGFDPATVTTAWVALGDSSRQNGCMQAVPGPARHDYAPERKLTIDEAKAINVELKSGEMSLHDVEIPHGSGPNHSEHKRVGFAIRYVRPDARPLEGRPPALLVRGRDRCGHFEVVGPPSQADVTFALATMKASAAQHLESILQNLRRR